MQGPTGGKGSAAKEKKQREEWVKAYTTLQHVADQLEKVRLSLLFLFPSLCKLKVFPSILILLRNVSTTILHRGYGRTWRTACFSPSMILPSSSALCRSVSLVVLHSSVSETICTCAGADAGEQSFEHCAIVRP